MSNLPKLPALDALMNAAFDYGAACHLAGRDGEGLPRQGSHAVKHAAETLLQAYATEAVLAERARLREMRSNLIRLAERVEAAGYRRGLDRRATSDYEPEIAALVNAIDDAVMPLPTPPQP